MIDIHCHILPGIDDGPKNKETSVEMLKMAKAEGIDKIIATPHYIRDMFENKYEDIKKGVDDLNGLAKENGIDVEIIPGQEIHLDKYTLELYKRGEIRGLNSSSYILFELPMDKMPEDTLSLIYELSVAGLKPILAHPERYKYIIEDIFKINDFINEGCLFEINSHSIEGLFGGDVKKTAKLLIKNGICDFIGTDAHSKKRRNPSINNSLQIAETYKTGIKEKVINNASFILDDTEINVSDRKILRKRKLFFMK